MNLTDWFAINPFHRVHLEPGTTRPVREVLHNGNGIDQRLVGEGDNESEAIAQALGTRARMQEVLP